MRARWFAPWSGQRKEEVEVGSAAVDSLVARLVFFCVLFLSCLGYLPAQVAGLGSFCCVWGFFGGRGGDLVKKES